MCGIAGTFGVSDPDVVSRMTAAMLHRGPDACGSLHDGDLRLGFRRLAIIDLERGNQPLRSETGDVSVVCNGEIYNAPALRRELEARGHTFATTSDVEVIVHEYEDRGLECLTRLEGMFALALWDAPRRRLLLARDRLGIKPLFFASMGKRLLFASELKAVLASRLVSREIAREDLHELLAAHAIAAPRTILRDVSALMPGHFLIADGAGTSPQRPFWELTRDETVAKLGDAEAEELVGHELGRAVHDHLQSDVPVGLFLSGGLDSAALLAGMRRFVSGRLKTFTVGFADADPAAESEIAAARTTAERFETDHHEIVVSGSDCLAAIDRAVVALDQPSADGLNSFFVASAASHRVKVALSGIGSDELLLGYGRDRTLVEGHAGLMALDELPGWYADGVRRVLSWLPSGYLTPGLERQRDWMNRPARLVSRYFGPGGIGLFTRNEIDSLLPGAASSPSASSILERRWGLSVQPDGEPLAGSLSRLELYGYASPVLLRDMDAMSMHQSLEVRVPFLDARFMRLAFSLPLRMKLRHDLGKYILRRVLRTWLPADVLERRKLGFSLPIGTWMRTRLRGLLRDVLSPAHVSMHRLFQPAATTQLLNRFLGGELHLQYRIWLLFVVHLWMDRVLEAGAHD